MIPDLGAYAGAVLGAYGVTLALLGLLVVVSAWRGAQARRALARLEGEGRQSDLPAARGRASAPQRSGDAGA